MNLPGAILLTLVALGHIQAAAAYRLVTAAHGPLASTGNTGGNRLHAASQALLSAEHETGHYRIAIGYVAQIRGMSQNKGMPSAEDSELITINGVPRRIRLPGSDPDGDALTFSILSQPTGGTVTLEDAATGSILFEPGTADGQSFRYSISDGVNTSAAITVDTYVTSRHEDRPRIISMPPLTIEESGELRYEIRADNRQLDTEAELQFLLVGEPAAGMSLEALDKHSARLIWPVNTSAGNHQACELLVIDPASRKAGYQRVMLHIAPAAAAPLGDG